MDVKKKVCSIIEKVIEDPSKNVTLESHLTHDLEIDSLTTIMILNELEYEFKVSFEDSAFAKVKTVSDIVQDLIVNNPKLGAQV